MRWAKTAALVALVALAGMGAVRAQSLRLSPVTVDMPPMSRSTFLTVENGASEPVQVQVRVFRWWLEGGQDRLERTAGVVVSPPMLNAVRGEKNVIRIIRISQAPILGEETYRVFVEEIPSRKRLQAATVVLAIRHSVPVFFGGLDAGAGSVSWSAQSRGGKLILSATNPGQKHVKISQLRVTDGVSRELISIGGLAGYALGGQTRTWQLPVARGVIKPGARLIIQAQTEAGPINAIAVLGGSG
jgi:fimbrial chaperone protein